MKYINFKKLEQISLNANNFAVVMDFDKTITKPENSDSWDAVGLFLDDKFKSDLTDLYSFYAPIEIDYSLKTEIRKKHMKDWYLKCINLYFKYGLTQELLIKSINSSNLLFRNGAKEFIDKLNALKIPIIIVSAGIGNVIEQFLKDNNCLSDTIYIVSNFIEFEPNGKMKLFNDDKIIHTMNKTMEGHIPISLQNDLIDRDFKILIGDLIDDTKMINSNELNKTIKIGFLNNTTEENFNLYKEFFDVILSENDASFNVVEQIVFKDKL